MAKLIGKLKLAPNVTAWCDEVNHIYLRRPNRVCKDIFENANLEPIMKGVEAGYVLFNEVVEVEKPAVKKASSSVNVNITNIKESAKRKRKAKQEQEVKEEVKQEEPKVEEVKEIKEEEKNDK